MSGIDKVKNREDVVLMRCIITKDKGRYFKAQDYNGNKYTIAKNSFSKKFKKGSDDTFYAYKETRGIFYKKEIYNPISTDEYLKLKDKY